MDRSNERLCVRPRRLWWSGSGVCTEVLELDGDGDGGYAEAEEEAQVGIIVS